MKRYAFGPPVQSVARLLALHDAKLLRFALADDPDIVVGDTGWQLVADGDSITANVMIDTVLASPTVSRVSSPLVKSLHRANTWNVVNEKLGVCTGKAGYFEKEPTSSNAPSIALVGRLATGSIVEADALMECFGPELKTWARSVVTQALR